LYGNNSRRDIATTNCINQGLKEDRLCIYASVNACDRSNLYNVSSKIKDYKENIKTGNLLIIDLKPFYNSALRGI